MEPYLGEAFLVFILERPNTKVSNLPEFIWYNCAKSTAFFSCFLTYL